jgi:hypothetical protein
MVLLDSRLPKDSNEILFAIFRVTDQKLWFSEDLDEIWFKNLIWICFNPRVATWRVLVGWYPFGWIVSVSRWILRGMDAPDQPTPFRLSGLTEAAGSRSNGRKGQRGNGLTGLGFRWTLRRDSGQRSHVGDAPAISGDDGVYDVMRLGEASSKASSRSSVSSWSGREAGLEVLTAPACSVIVGYCKIRGKENMSMSARSRGFQGYHGGTVESPCSAGIGVLPQRIGAPPARNFSSLAALSTQEQEGKRRGERGLFIGAAGEETGRGFNRIEEGI